MAKPVCSIIIVAIGLGRSADYACPEKLRGKRCRQTSWSGRGRVPETNLGHTHGDIPPPFVQTL